MVTRFLCLHIGFAMLSTERVLPVDVKGRIKSYMRIKNLLLHSSCVGAAFTTEVFDLMAKSVLGQQMIAEFAVFKNINK